MGCLRPAQQYFAIILNLAGEMSSRIPISPMSNISTVISVPGANDATLFLNKNDSFKFCFPLLPKG